MDTQKEQVVIWIASGRMTTNNALRSVGCFLQENENEENRSKQAVRAKTAVFPDRISTCFESALSGRFWHFFGYLQMLMEINVGFFPTKYCGWLPPSLCCCFLSEFRLYTLHNLLLAKEQQCENHKVFVVYVKINSVKLQEHIGQTT